MIHFILELTESQSTGPCLRSHNYYKDEDGTRIKSMSPSPKNIPFPELLSTKLHYWLLSSALWPKYGSLVKCFITCPSLDFLELFSVIPTLQLALIMTFFCASSLTPACPFFYFSLEPYSLISRFLEPKSGLKLRFPGLCEPVVFGFFWCW